MADSTPKAAFDAAVATDPNVVGTYTARDGHIVVLVRKISAARSAYGAPSDVEYRVQRESFQAWGMLPAAINPLRTTRQRPFQSGDSCGHPLVTAGTVGPQARNRADGRICFISNAHVVAAVNQGQIGDIILQPGRADGGRDPQDRVGTLLRKKPIRWQASGEVNLIDAGLVGLDGPGVMLHQLPGKRGYPMGYGDTFIGDWVAHVGRTSDWATGEVIATDVTVQVGYGPGQVAVFEDQVLVAGGGQPGDSGSGVYSFCSGRYLGELFAGSAGQYLFCKAWRVLGEMDSEMIPAPERWLSWLVDVSHWNSPITSLEQSREDNFKANIAGLTPLSFSQMREKDVRGVILKVGQLQGGVWVTDPWFERYYDYAHQAGMEVVTGYTFLQPQESAQAHIEGFCNAMGDRRFNAPPAIDAEVAQGQTPQMITSVIQNFDKGLTEWYGSPSMMYSSLSWWKENVLRDPDFMKNPEWVAWWPSPLVMEPLHLEDWKNLPDPNGEGKECVWQVGVSDAGAEIGVGSKSVDMNKTSRRFERLIGNGQPPPPITVGLTVHIMGSGYVSPGGGQYTKDTTLQLQATPSQDWRFDHWEDDLTGNANPASLLMNTDKEVTADFDEVSDRTIFNHFEAITTVRLNCRSGPGTQYTLLFTMPIGERVAVLEEKIVGSDQWARIGRNQWCATLYRGAKYVEWQ